MTHGLRSSYKKGCRCGDCTRANREYAQALRLGNPVTTGREFKMPEGLTPCSECSMLCNGAICHICEAEQAGRRVWMNDTEEFIKRLTLMFEFANIPDSDFTRRTMVFRNGG